MPWEHLSEDAQRMLETLIIGKRKLDRLKKNRARLIFLFAVASIELAYLLFHVVRGSQTSNVMSAFSAFMDNTLFITTVSVWLGSLMALGGFSKTIEKKDLKYEELRKEAVDRLRAAWWRTSDSGKRDALSREMHLKYGVNIAYKNKGK